MTDSAPEIYADIDWKRLRANAIAKKGWQKKSPADWDLKARSFSCRNKNSTYIDLVLSHLPLKDSFTVLDIGSGPGTLAIPLAPRVKSVTAIDFSQGMLDVLEEIAHQEKIDNIHTVQCAWEDDWEDKGLLPHDIAIASRSMGVMDLTIALGKINKYGTRYVFLTDRIGSTPFDEGAFEAVGRPFTPGPDYIYTLNILYTLGIHPNVTVLKLEQDIEYASMDEAVKSYSWMFHDITKKEHLALVNYLAGKIIQTKDNRLIIRRDSPPQWALIWWEKATEKTY